MRLYRLLLHLYPASFRADYGEEMAAIFRRQLRSASGVRRLALWLTVVQEVMMNAPAAHWDILKQDLRYTARTLNRARGFALTAILVTAAWRRRQYRRILGCGFRAPPAVALRRPRQRWSGCAKDRARAAAGAA